jgi:MazG family protein
LKAEEKRAAGKVVDGADTSLLDGVSAKVPALIEAHQLATKAARVGFDWRNVEEIFDKLHEEIDELRAAIREHREAGVDAEAEHERVREEVGDLLFAVTNIARHLSVEPEAALKLTNRKFRRRFRHIERSLRALGRDIGAAMLEEMEELWREAKQDQML